MRSIYIILAFCLIISNVYSDVFRGKKANQLFHGAELIYTDSSNGTLKYVSLSSTEAPAIEDFDSWLRKNMGQNNDFTYSQINSETDVLGITHVRFILTFRDVPVREGVVIAHVNNGKVKSFNGTLLSEITPLNNKTISETDALDIALNTSGGKHFMWESESEESLLKQFLGDQNATYFPKADLVWLLKNSDECMLTYAFNIYSKDPLSRKMYFINCETGLVEKIIDLLHFSDVQGVAETKYSGQRSIITDSITGSYRLREAGRGNGIETYNMQLGTDYGSAIDFSDDDNYWNNVNAEMDEVATDAHWATEMTYDYYLEKHGRNSIDNAGFKLRSYVHFNLIDYGYSSNVNAFWNGQWMTYGDGDASYTPLTTVDICGHEVTHGLTSNTADLDYSDESGALNEGFSDIFATLIEFYAKPEDANWTIAEDIGGVFRSLSNPVAYGKPDTYHGNYWYSGTGDNGGVHTNSTVLSYWFYLLSEGGTGTNDLGDNYSVNGLGMEVAGQITYRTLVYYLTNNSDYEDARFYAFISAADLFGECTPEVESVVNAMYAVGIGNAYLPEVYSDFDSDFTTQCAPPAAINFHNQSINGISFIWDFGDGNTSSEISPSHVYQDFGQFNVKLIADGGSCGIDTVIKSSYISVDVSNPCITIMPSVGGFTEANCSGTLYDDGGSGYYSDNSDCYIVIAPPGADSVRLVFSAFDYELDWDTLFIYDGPDVLSPLIGGYTGMQLPENGTITSSGGSITIRQLTDQAVTRPGFILEWNCFYPNVPPVADFVTDVTETCTGTVQFIDQSANAVDSWTWIFGDGTVSYEENPLHYYTTNGAYTVTLIAANGFGADTVIFENLINVSIPEVPVPVDTIYCGLGNKEIFVQSQGQVLWYDSINAVVPAYTGNPYFYNLPSQSSVIYAQTFISDSVGITGKQDNTGGGGYFGNIDYIHYLVFDCYSPCILKSVKVYASGAGNRHIALRDKNMNILQEITVYVPNGESRVELNFNLPVDDNLQLVGMEAPNLYRNSAGVLFPYILDGFVDVKFSSASTAPYDYYYYFYEWELYSECYSEKIEVPVISIDGQFDLGADTVQYDIANQTSYSPGAGYDSYLWSDGSTDQFFTPTESGYFWCSADKSGCTFYDSVYVESTVGIADYNNNVINVFPNPSLGLLYISVPEEITDIKIEIFDSRSRKMDIGFRKERSNFITTSELPKGIYFVMLLEGDRTRVKKVVVL